MQVYVEAPVEHNPTSVDGPSFDCNGTSVCARGCVCERILGGGGPAISVEDFIATVKQLQSLLCDIGDNVPTQPPQLLACVVLALLKGSEIQSLVNAANKGLETKASLAEILTSLQQIKDFQSISGEKSAANYKGAVQANMGAATNYNTANMGAATNYNAILDDPIQECRKCKDKGVVYSCKKSEWLAHAKIYHPLPPRGANDASRTHQLPEHLQARRIETKALFAYMETLPENQDTFSFAGMVYQIEGDDVIEIGLSASKHATAKP